MIQNLATSPTAAAQAAAAESRPTPPKPQPLAGSLGPEDNPTLAAMQADLR